MTGANKGSGARQVLRLQDSQSRDAAAELLTICANLSHADKLFFTYLLLQQMFLRNGTNPYVAWAEWNEFDRRTYYLLLSEISEDLANAWYDWAFAVSNEDPSRRRDNTVLDLLRDLIRSSSPQELFDWARSENHRSTSK
jgi:hypothetical protein